MCYVLIDATDIRMHGTLPRRGITREVFVAVVFREAVESERSEEFINFDEIWSKYLSEPATGCAPQ